MLSDNAIGRSSVTRYSPGVLIGNWYEEMRQKEDKLRMYKLKKQYAVTKRQDPASNPVALENLKQRLSTPVNISQVFQMHQQQQPPELPEDPAADLTYDHFRCSTIVKNPNNKPRVPMGVPLMILSKKTGGALALDTAPKKDSDPFEGHLSATPSNVPMLRSTWTIFPCPDDNNAAYRSEWLHEPNILHYGQHVRLANENVSEMGFYYIQSDLVSGHYAMKNQPAQVYMGANANNIFVVGRPGHRRGDPTTDGRPVRMGEAVILYHSLTGQPLHCSGEVTSNAFGGEMLVCCHLERQNHSFGRGAVGVCEENMFYFTTGGEDDGPRTKSQQTSVDINEVLSLSCGDGVDCVLARLRQGAIRFGGRTGLRAFSRALRSAGAEGRYPQYLDRQGLVEHISKLGVYVLPIELDAIMKRFDHSGNNLVCTQELMKELRGDINPDRLKAVVQAFQRLLIEGRGSVEFKDMFNLYKENAHGHPDVMDGLVSREDICRDFEYAWPSNIINTKLGTVRLDEFVEYYSDISPAVYDDRRFLMTLRNCWMIPLTDDYLKGETRRELKVQFVNGDTKTLPVPDTLTFDAENKETVKQILVAHGLKDLKDFGVTYTRQAADLEAETMKRQQRREAEVSA